MTAKRILVVDDDERNRKLMDSMVHAEGYLDEPQARAQAD